jgi:hypothetical protein
MKKTYSQLQFELSRLVYLLHSRYGTEEPDPSVTEKIQKRIIEIRNQIKELK